MGEGYHCCGTRGRCSGREGCRCECGYCLKERGYLDWDVELCEECWAPLLGDRRCPHCDLKEDLDAVMTRVVEGEWRVRPPDKRLYVAGGSSERALVRQLIDAVIEAGYEVTFDWERCGAFGEGADLAEQARLDLDAVRSAGVLWYVAPAAKSEGSHAELGAAIVLGKLVVVSGRLDASRIFPRLAAHRFEEHAEALEFLNQRIKE